MSTKIIVSAKPPTVTAEVQQFLEENEPCTIRTIAEVLSINTNSVRTILVRLHQKGIVRRCNNAPMKGAHWEMGCDENLVFDEEPPKRERITSWEPHMVRDPLVAAFYGPPAIV